MQQTGEKKVIRLFFFLGGPLLSGLLLALAFPPYDQAWLGWVALVPLLLTVRRLRAWQALVAGWLAGAVFMAILCAWLNEIESVSMVASSLMYLYLGLYPGLTCAFTAAVRKRTALPLSAAAPIWVCFEFLRSNIGFLSCPWGVLGYSQSLNLPIIQMASVTGVYGVSFVMVLFNATLADLFIIVKQNRQSASGGAKRLYYTKVFCCLSVFLGVATLWLWGKNSIPAALQGTSFSLAIVQGNISTEMKRNAKKHRNDILQKYEALSKEAALSKPQLIVWPEASAPGYVLFNPSLKNQIISMVRRINTHFVIGSAEYMKFEDVPPDPLKVGNTAVFFSPQGKLLGQYLKVHLVPFGEYLPYEGIIPWPDFIIKPEYISMDQPGKALKVFTLDGKKFGVLICWENIFPELSRSLASMGADLILNISNEGYFGKTGAPYQLLAMCVFRAVENRVHIARATNTGISCFIDPFGRVSGVVTNSGEALFVEGVSSREIFLSKSGSIYTRYGDVLAYVCVAFFLCLLVWSVFRYFRPALNSNPALGNKNHEDR